MFRDRSSAGRGLTQLVTDEELRDNSASRASIGMRSVPMRASAFWARPKNSPNL